MWSRQAEQREAHEVANNLVYSSIASTHLVSSSVSALGLDPLFPTRGTADGMDPNFDTALAVVDGSVLDSSIGTIRQSKQRRSKSERKTVVQQCTQKSRVDRVHRRAVADCLRNSSTIINGPWPPASFREQFPDIFKNFEIRPSTIPNAGYGLFTKVPLAKGTVIGPYGGTYSSSANRGPYAMEIHTRDGIKYNVDGANRQDPWALLGAINEYTWDLQKNNCALREDGLVVTVRDVSTSPGELFMYMLV